jgi:hypothetical protein
MICNQEPLTDHALELLSGIKEAMWAIGVRSNIAFDYAELGDRDGLHLALTHIRDEVKASLIQFNQLSETDRLILASQKRSAA